MLDVVSPKGGDGKVAGFGVPLGAETTKEDLGRPLARGAYAIASPDQKTVLKLLVLCKEEAGYDPAAFLASSDALELSDETRARIQSTWSLLQLTFESYDPAVIPAVKFLLQTSGAFARATVGVVADPISQAYRLPDEVITPISDPATIHSRDVVTVKARIEQGAICLFTLGWQKFDRPEIELRDVPEGFCRTGIDLLTKLSQTILAGTLLDEGDRIVEGKVPFRAAPGRVTATILGGKPVLELVPERGTVEEALTSWSGSQVEHQSRIV